MGKKLIIPGADFSANAIEIMTIKSVSPNTSFNLINGSTIESLTTDSNGYYERDGHITFNGSSSAINLFDVAANTGVNYIKSVSNIRLNTTNTQYMFGGCNALEKVYISDVVTGDTAINMGNMFSHCSSLNEVVIKSQTKIKVGNLDGFLRDSSLTIEKLDLSRFDTSELTTMEMFNLQSGQVCALAEVDFSGWDLSSFDTSTLSNYQYAFLANSNLKKAIVNDCSAATITKLITILGTSGLTYTQGTDAAGNTVLIGA